MFSSLVFKAGITDARSERASRYLVKRLNHQARRHGRRWSPQARPDADLMAMRETNRRIDNRLDALRDGNL